MTIHIPHLAPGLNGKRGLIRMHWSERKSLTRLWTTLVRASVMTPPRLTSCDLTYTRHTTRLMDWDNLAGSCKIPLDALVHAGILVDDAPEVIRTLTVRQERVKTRKGQGTTIEITTTKEAAK